MDCAFCGDEITGKPIRQDGQVFCSIDCADTAAEVGINGGDDEDESEDEYEDGLDEFQDNSIDQDYYDEADGY